MTSKKRGRPPKFSAKTLTNAGYTYKMDVLTDQEKEWLSNGVPTDKPNVKTPPPDYFYYFKVIDGVEVKIFKVGDWFVYEGVKLKSADQIPICEKNAIESAKYSGLQEKMKDTEPMEISELFKPELKEANPALGTIELKGGPLDGQFVTYNNALPFYMAQYKVPMATVNSGAIPPVMQTMAARYKRSKDNRDFYEFDRNF